MNGKPVLTDDAQKGLLRRCWYAHDARWFMSVAEEVGLEAANRLNRRVCRALGEAEMRRLAAALDIATPTTVQQMVEVVDAAMRFFAPPPLTTFDTWVIDERSYGIWVRHCFIHDKVVRAGIASSYTCTAFDRVQGWHDALELPLVEDPLVLPCPKVLGQECIRIMTSRLGGRHGLHSSRRNRDAPANPAQVCD